MTEAMVVLELTPAQRRLVENALQTYLSDFGHEDYDLIAETRAVLAKLQATMPAASAAPAGTAAGD